MINLLRSMIIISLFLIIAPVPLLKIDKIENYLRIADTTGLTINIKDIIEIDSKKQLEYLQNDELQEFNVYHENENIWIHIPYVKLQERKLAGEMNFRKSFLFKIDLKWADLTGADLKDSSFVFKDF